MVRCFGKCRAMLAALLVVTGLSTANAGLLPVSVTVTPESGNHRWTYSIVLPTDMKLQSGNYFTIYDFEGYLPGGESAPADWTFSTQLTGLTPAFLTPFDDPAKPNLIWTYSGPTINSGQVGLGNFWAVSSYSDAKDSSFTAITNRTSDGDFDSNITTTSTPTGNQVPGVPEPATLLMAALGLPLIGLRRFVFASK